MSFIRLEDAAETVLMAARSWALSGKVRNEMKQEILASANTLDDFFVNNVFDECCDNVSEQSGELSNFRSYLRSRADRALAAGNKREYGAYKDALTTSFWLDNNKQHSGEETYEQ